MRLKPVVLTEAEKKLLEEHGDTFAKIEEKLGPLPDKTKRKILLSLQTIKENEYLVKELAKLG